MPDPPVGPGAHVARLLLRVVWAVLTRVMASPRLTAVANRMTPGPRRSARRYRVRHDGHDLFAGSLDRLLALYLWKHGVIEAHELAVARALIRPGTVVVDVGANVGFHTIQFAKWTGPAGHVHAFEPEPDNFAILQANIEASGLGNITAHPLAVTDAPGCIEMFVSPSHRGDHRIFQTPEGRASIPVQATSLDAVFGGHEGPISLVKIDVQGAEALVLRGMRALLAAHPETALAAEFSPGLMREMARDPREVVDELGRLGRPIRRIDERSASSIPCEPTELARLAATERDMNLVVLPAPAAGTAS